MAETTDLPAVLPACSVMRSISGRQRCRRVDTEINTDKEKLFLKNEELSPCLPVSVSHAFGVASFRARPAQGGVHLW